MGFVGVFVCGLERLGRDGEEEGESRGVGKGIGE